MIGHGKVTNLSPCMNADFQSCEDASDSLSEFVVPDSAVAYDGIFIIILLAVSYSKF